jgi:hypothetical protein
MSASGKRASSLTVDDASSMPPMPGTPTSRPVKQVRLETSLDVHEAGPLLYTDKNGNTEQDKRCVGSATLAGDADYTAILNAMKAKITDLEAKLLQMQTPVPTDFAPFFNGDVEHPDNLMPELTKEEPSTQRKPAKPLLNRVSWVPFKNLYLDEDVYAVDVLMVLKIILVMSNS